jgi:hypothetical protein
MVVSRTTNQKFLNLKLILANEYDTSELVRIVVTVYIDAT